MLMFGFISLMLLAYVLPSTVEGQSIRLVSSSGSTSSSNTAGRLEVYYSGQWASVCTSGFGASDAHAACRQLGYTTYIRYGSVYSLGYSPASTSTTILPYEYLCTSTSTRLSQCSTRRYTYNTCSHSQDVAISCTSSSSTTISSIRLVSSSGSTSTSNTAGRLEVYYSGAWASVCTSGFGASDARTACRQLGYTTYIRYGSVYSLGYSSASTSTTILPYEFLCTSTSTRLNQCSTRGNTYTCSHSQDVAISCTSSSSNSLQKGSNTVAVVCGIIALLLPLINFELQ